MRDADFSSLVAAFAADDAPPAPSLDRLMDFTYTSIPVPSILSPNSSVALQPGRKVSNSFAYHSQLYCAEV
jgi:hypothetical protein